MCLLPPTLSCCFTSWDSSSWDQQASTMTQSSCPSQHPTRLKADPVPVGIMRTGQQSPTSPLHPSPAHLPQLLAYSLSVLAATMKASAPCSHPSPRSKPLWTHFLTTLPKQCQDSTSLSQARQSRSGYFKAINKAKSKYWAHSLRKTTPPEYMDGKKLVTPQKTPCFPSLAGPSNHVSIIKALLDYFSLPKNHLPLREHPSHHPSADPKT